MFETCTANLLVHQLYIRDQQERCLRTPKTFNINDNETIPKRNVMDDTFVFSKGKLSEYFSIFKGAAVKFARRESTPSAGSYAKRLSFTLGLVS